MKALIVDDDVHMAKMLANTLIRRVGVSAEYTASPKEAETLLSRNAYDILVTDIFMDEKSGLDLMEYTKRTSAETQIVVITASNAVELAVRCLKNGACDYLIKPFELDEFIISMNNLVERIRLKQENTAIREMLTDQFGFHNIIGASPKMLQVVEDIRRASDIDAPVLIHGESGTGKELVARALHVAGSRKNKRFIAVNCAAIPEEIFESELFGHTKGSFTGADRDKKGLFEQAAGGTVFLDEISEMPYPLQAKLLRVLELKKVRRVGDFQEIDVDFRIVAASNRDLATQIRKQLFREDLYFRLNVITLELPPLRERPEDIMPLIQHYLSRRGLMLRFTRQAEELLCRYRWQGNVRELNNMIERLLFKGKPLVDVDDLPAEVAGPQGQCPAPVYTDVTYADAKNMAIDEFTRNYLTQAMLQHEGNVSAAARESGVDRPNFLRLLKKYSINPERYRSS